MDKLRGLYHNRWVVLVMGILFGAATLLAVRFATYAPEYEHYHANFAIYLNGTREEFKAPRYYQDVAICKLGTGLTNPQQRAHLHNNVNSAVHVHDQVTTWGQFFENIGWTVGPDLIETDTGAKYIADDTSKLHVIIDGQDYTDLTPIANMIIKDESRVLLSFGAIDQASLQQQFASVERTAAKYNHSTDPAACSGNERPSISDRFHNLL